MSDDISSSSGKGSSSHYFRGEVVSRRTLCAVLIVVLPIVCAGQIRQPATPAFKVKVEATQLDRQMLLQKLNTNGADHDLKFVLADADFDYRIVFNTGQQLVGTIYGQLPASAATTSVFDSQGTELFQFGRQGRATDSGATNAVAKEIIKRMLQLKGGTSQTGSTGVAALLGVAGYATEAGFKITSVRAGSAAERIFLKSGDIILKIDGHEVKSSVEIETAIAASTTGMVKVTCLIQAAAAGMLLSDREVKVR